MEFISKETIVELSNPGVISRQLLNPDNSTSERVTITEVHLEVGASQPRHTHKASEQIWYATKGCGKLLLADEKEMEFKAGDVVRFAEKDVHGLLNDGEDEFVYVSDDDRYRGGWSNLDLIPEGKEQARQLAKYLKENNHNYAITQIISSDLPRTMTTARFLSDELDIPIQKESQIREANNGDLAGMLNDDALKKYPGLFFYSLKMDEAYPNGESPSDFYNRINKWFSEFLSEYCNEKGNILIVTHGGVINAIYHLVKGLEWNNRGQAFKVGNCSIHILNMDTMKFEVENKTDFLAT